MGYTLVDNIFYLVFLIFSYRPERVRAYHVDLAFESKIFYKLFVCISVLEVEAYSHDIVGLGIKNIPQPPLTRQQFFLVSFVFCNVNAGTNHLNWLSGLIRLQPDPSPQVPDFPIRSDNPFLKNLILFGSKQLV